MADYFSAVSALNNTTPTIQHDNTTHFITSFPVSQRKLTDDGTSAIPPWPLPTAMQQTIDWLDLLNKVISRRDKVRLPPGTMLWSGQTHPAVIYTSAAVIICVGAVGNAMLLLLSFRPEVVSHSYSVFLAVISVCDTFCLVNFYILMITQEDVTNGNDNVYVCRFRSWLMGFLLTVSPWLHNAFNVDRYVALVHPLKRRVVCTIRNARIACSVTCLVLAVEQVCWTAGMDMVPYGQGQLCAISGSVAYVLNIVAQLLNSIVASILQLVLNLRILVTLIIQARRRRAMISGGQSDGPRVESQQDSASSAFEMSTALLSIPIFTMLTHLPYHGCFTFISIWIMITDPMQETGSTIIDIRLEPCMQIIFTISYAGSFWMLIISSKSFRSIAIKILKRQ